MWEWNKAYKDENKVCKSVHNALNQFSSAKNNQTLMSNAFNAFKTFADC